MWIFCIYSCGGLRKNNVKIIMIKFEIMWLSNIGVWENVVVCDIRLWIWFEN